jgi:hypothetical protein
VKNVMISGPGLIDGSYMNAAGNIVNVLTGDDPPEVTVRTAAGTPGGANKAIALKNASNIVMRDFRIRNGGHFAVLGSGVVNWTMDGVLIDTNRDAVDIDAAQNVTVRNGTFNSPTDDALVLKGTFGLGVYMPTKNVLIEHCAVSGYDAGSVIDGTYTTHKIVATDRDGPTARIKVGTEGTTGFDTVTVRNVTFDRSRGFALESVDSAELKNIVFSDATMTHISSSPIFIRIGDRGRAPVTGNSATSEATQASANLRLDDRGWVLPDMPKYGAWPVVRTIPSYDKTAAVTVGGAANPFTIVSRTAPTKLNPYAARPNDPLAANAVGTGYASVRNVSISRITVTDADPRYPILLAGLVDHPVEDISISDVSVQYRGGLTMAHAVEQRQIDRTIAYTSYQAAPATQSVPWLVNTFFAKNEALLPRIGWDATANGRAGAWVDDPYNVPEMPREYPEPSLFGVLPAYGMYVRHARGVSMRNVVLGYAAEDTRAAVVLDDVQSGAFAGVSAQTGAGAPMFVRVTNTRKRLPDFEYVPDQPYRTTTVTNVTTPAGALVQDVTVSRPAPGTPADTLYALPSAPDAAHPYAYRVPDATYPLPATVHPGLGG